MIQCKTDVYVFCGQDVNVVLAEDPGVPNVYIVYSLQNGRKVIHTKDIWSGLLVVIPLTGLELQYSFPAVIRLYKAQINLEPELALEFALTTNSTNIIKALTVEYIERVTYP